jgi:hypothetical protein
MVDRSHVWDELIASDADLARLRTAGRATLTATLAAEVLDLGARAVHQPATATLIGMMGSAVTADPTPRRQAVTLALLPVVASAAAVAGTLVAPVRWLSTAALLGIVFVAVFVRQFGPRGTAPGTLGFLAYFFSLFFQARASQLPWMIVGLFLATAVAGAVRFGVLRERPVSLLVSDLPGLSTRLGHSGTKVRHFATEVRHFATEVRHFATEVRHFATEVRHFAPKVRHFATCVDPQRPAA